MTATLPPAVLAASLNRVTDTAQRLGRLHAIRDLLLFLKAGDRSTLDIVNWLNQEMEKLCP